MFTRHGCLGANEADASPTETHRNDVRPVSELFSPLGDEDGTGLIDT